MTVDIKTSSPAPLLLRGLADIPIESKAHTEKVGQAEAHKKPMGTGPWKYVEWVAGDRYDLAANDDYWGGAPAMKKLRIRAIPEGATRVASLVAGETDIIEEIPVDLLPSVEKRKNLEDRCRRIVGQPGAHLRHAQAAVQRRARSPGARLRDRQADAR